MALAAIMATPAAARTAPCIQHTETLEQAYASFYGRTRQWATVNLRAVACQSDRGIETGYRFPGGSPPAEIGKRGPPGGHGRAGTLFSCASELGRPNGRRFSAPRLALAGRNFRTDR